MNDTLKIGIIDDDKGALSIISASVSSILKAKNISFAIETFDNSANLLCQDESHIFDILFCDIEMPGKDGIVVSSEYHAKHPYCEIVFISNREDKVFDSLKVHPFGFIRKKNFLEDIRFLMDSYFKKMEENDDSSSIVFSSGSNYNKVKIKDIVFIESRRKYQYVHIVNKEEPLEITSTMRELEEQLTPYGFIATHKAYLVNYKYIKDIDSNSEIHLSTGDRVFIAVRKCSEVKERYLQLVKDDTKLIF